MSEKAEKKKGITRRGFLKTSLAGAAGLAIGGPWGIGKAGAAEKPITFGLNGVASGAGGMSGVAARCGVELWAEEVNKRGGLLGRQVQVIQRDTQGKPEEAVRYTREFASSGIDFIVAHGSSAEAFAVETISKELKRLIIAGAEATEFTADPKVRSPYCFRFARNALLMGINFGQYAGKIFKEARPRPVVHHWGRLFLRPRPGKLVRGVPQEIQPGSKYNGTGMAQTVRGGLHVAYHRHPEQQAAGSLYLFVGGRPDRFPQAGFIVRPFSTGEVVLQPSRRSGHYHLLHQGIGGIPGRRLHNGAIPEVNP